jgi:hypothetical protein
VTKARSRSLTDPPHETKYEDAVKQFLGACPQWSTLLQAWRADGRYRSDVVPFVESFKTTVLYTLTPEDVQAVCRKTEHALGNVKRRAAEAVRPAVDWNPAFALEHALHSAAEELKQLPTYQEFREYCDTDSAGKRMLGGPSRALRARLVAGGLTNTRAKDAIRWRIGNAYLSFVREAYLIAVLRCDLELAVHYHPLADVLFRTDAWVGNIRVLMHVRNAEFREGSAGRKPLLPCSGMRSISFELPKRHAFGVVHLPDRQAIARKWKEES